MSRFYASVTGSAQNPVTRQGTPRSGAQGHIRGWNMGISVAMYVNAGGEDEAIVHITGGSNGTERTFAFTVRDDAEDGIVIDMIGDALAAVVLEEEEN